MATPRNGFSTNKSSSPLRITSADPFIATSRNLSSFGSRQTWSRSAIATGSAIRASKNKNRSRSCFETYRSNFGRAKTEASSSSVASETSKVPPSAAVRTAIPDMESGNKSRLTSTLVSITMRSLLFIREQVGQNLVVHALRLCLSTNVIGEPLKLRYSCFPQTVVGGRGQQNRHIPALVLDDHRLTVYIRKKSRQLLLRIGG